MKDLIIIIGTILLGVVIVNSMILGDSESSLKGAAEKVMDRGSMSIERLGGEDS